MADPNVATWTELIHWEARAKQAESERDSLLVAAKAVLALPFDMRMVVAEVQARNVALHQLRATVETVEKEMRR